MSDVSFVRTEMLQEQAPPATSVGVLGWMRENLFSSVINSILTILSLAFIVYLLVTLLPWALVPTWHGTSLTECRAILTDMGLQGHNSGACWGVVRDRWVQFIFGFYPSDAYWRPILAFVLMLAGLAPVLFERAPRILLWIIPVFPFAAVWLLWGGAIWTPVLVALGLVIAVAVYMLSQSKLGATLALGAAVVSAIVWWLVLVSPINDGINKALANARYDSEVAEAQDTMAALPPVIGAKEARVKEIQGELKAKAAAFKEDVKTAEAAFIATLSAEDADYLGKILKARGHAREVLLEASPTHHAIYEDLLAKRPDTHGLVGDLTPLRQERDELNRQLALLKLEQSDARGYLKRLQDLPKRIEGLPARRAKAQEARAALPDTVRGFTTQGDYVGLEADVKNGVSTIPNADLAALRKVASLENAVIGEEIAIKNAYADAARIGLKPVESRKFGGLLLSVMIGVTAIMTSLPVGILLALGRQSNLLIVKAMCVGFIEFIRGVPLITLLFVASTLLNIFMPPGTNFDIILRVMIMVSVFAAAYMAEVVRGGLAALPTGQYEGADSLGLTYWQAQRLIIMPQALKISIPAIVSTFIGVFKDTTLVSVIGLLDPLGLTQAIRADAAWNGIVWEMYGFVAFMFFVLCFSMSRYSMYLERKLQTGHK